jgi:glycosyltransferase involved in cell wall biosynthesis
LTSPQPSTQVARPVPRASVVIPTYNRCEALARVLRALARQTVPGSQFEVLVVADGCTDGTADLCRQVVADAPYVLRLLEQDNRGPAEARNHGVREALAPLIVFVDDDVVPSPELLEVHLCAHAPDGGDNVVAIGPLLPPEDRRLNAWGAWEERTLCALYDDLEAGRWKPSHYNFYTGNASLARRHILDVGGFHPEYRRAEDIELSSRLDAKGCAFHFLPQARAWHHVHRSFPSWAAMPVAYGRASVMMGRAGRTEAVARDIWFYTKRNRAVQCCTRWCAGSSWHVGVITQALHLLALASWNARLSALTYAACSVIYNVRFYDSMAAELGSPRRFWRLVAAAEAAHHNQGDNSFLEVCADVLGIGREEDRVVAHRGTRAMV